MEAEKLKTGFSSPRSDGESFRRAEQIQRTDLDENVHVLQIVPTPFVKGLQQLEAVALRADVYCEAAAVRGRVLVGVLAGVKVFDRQFISVGGVQLELLSIRGCKVICLGVEVQRSSDGQGSDDLRERKRKSSHFHRGWTSRRMDWFGVNLPLGR